MNLTNISHLILSALVFELLTVPPPASAAAMRLDPAGEQWFLIHPTGQDRVRLSSAAPGFDFGSFQLGGTKAGNGIWHTNVVEGDLQWTGEWSVIEPRPAEIRAVLRLHPQANLLYKTAELRLKTGSPALLRSVLIDEVDAAGQTPLMTTGWQSYPVLGRAFFFGVAYPAATTQVQGERVRFQHAPGKLIAPGEWFTSRTAVYGAAEPGQSRAAFENYIRQLRPAPRGLHVNYNSWWTSPVPYTETDILTLIREFKEHLYVPYGISLDSFTIDMGWAINTQLWQIDPKLFPQGFTNLARACGEIGSNLGLWISPSGMYPQALDLAWARNAGYEADTKACLGGARYQAAFKQSLLKLSSRFDLRQVKFDGYTPACEATNHGHPPGSLSIERTTEGIVDVFLSLRKTAPNLWMEPTCFGFNPSPWWLEYCNSVIGTFGDDAPHGRVPCPIYRESYTTGRDYYNLKGAQDILFPIAAQEVLGIIHQTEEPLQNDAVMTVLRGHQFLPLYVNPKYMNPRRWEFLAALLRWSRQNADILEQTRPIFPPSWGRAERMPREPYGYAHAQGDRALVCLRNPWILPAAVRLNPGQDLGLASVGEKHCAVSLYPEHETLAERLDPAFPITIALRPYETKLVEVKSQPAQFPARNSFAPDSSFAEVKRLDSRRVRFNASGPAFGSNYTRFFAGQGPYLRTRFSVELQPSPPRTCQLVFLVEGRSAVGAPWCKLTTSATAGSNAKPLPFETISSESGWVATVAPVPEHWAWVLASCPGETCDVAGEIMLTDPAQKLTAFLLERKNMLWQPDQRLEGLALPPPEWIYTSAQELFHAEMTNGLTEIAEEAPTERIEGVHLDSLEPVSAKQGFGTLQRNRSVWEKPLKIGGRQFARGLGTHSPAEIRYALDGKYRRFTAWAGADQATAPTLTMSLKVDGATVWQSGLLTRESPAQRIDLNVAGVKTLEWIVTDGGNGISADHADLADAILWP